MWSRNPWPGFTGPEPAGPQKTLSGKGRKKDMAGDWIKMRCDLGNDPAVIRMAETLKLSEDDVVGKLHRFWSWADTHTTDGNASGVTKTWLDRYIGVTGFAERLAEGDGRTPWLVITEDGIEIPKFEEHNGKSAKKRLLTTKRVAQHRAKRNATSVTDVTQAALQKRYQRREEKRREEKEEEPPPSPEYLNDQNTTPADRIVRVFVNASGRPAFNGKAPAEVQAIRDELTGHIDRDGEDHVATRIQTLCREHIESGDPLVSMAAALHFYREQARPKTPKTDGGRQLAIERGIIDQEGYPLDSKGNRLPEGNGR